MASAASIVGALQQASRTVPIVFVSTIDPVGSGLVASLAKPGGNATGFIAWEFSMSGKLLELLKEFAPRVTRVAVLRDADVPAGAAGFAAIQTVAPAFGVELTPIGVHDAEEIERGIAAFARGPNDGLIMVGPPSSAQRHRDVIVTLAARHRLPAVYPVRYFVDVRRPDLLWARHRRPVSPRRRLRRPHPQGREARRPAGTGADQVRAGHQSQDRQGARPRRAPHRCSPAPTR